MLEKEREVHDLLQQVSSTIVGARLRRARLRMGLSIRDLAQQAHVSKNSIVRLEQGGSPNAMTLMKVCGALGMHVAALSKPTDTEGQIRSIHRKDDDRWYDLTDFGSGPLEGQNRPLTPDERSAIVERGAQVPLLILKSRLETGRLLPTVIELYKESERRSHAGEEFVYVLHGRATILLGNETIELEEGEAVTFWSAEEHAYAPSANSELPARILSVRIDDKPAR